MSLRVKQIANSARVAPAVGPVSARAFTLARHTAAAFSRNCPGTESTAVEPRTDRTLSKVLDTGSRLDSARNNPLLTPQPRGSIAGPQERL